MGSASKEKLDLARAEAVQRLLTLAVQIEQGALVLGGKTFSVPDQVHLEIKADGGELEIELKWGVSVEGSA